MLQVDKVYSSSGMVLWTVVMLIVWHLRNP